MTKEELKQEAEKEACKHWFAYPIEQEIFKQGYLACAEPREKRIAELSRKCDELIADKLVMTATYNEVLNDLNQNNDKLQKENAELEAQIEKMKCWHKMDYNDKESCKKIPRCIQLLTEYSCGLFVAYCVNRWTGENWEEHRYGITRWKEIKENV